jgi:hypothetical protein
MESTVNRLLCHGSAWEGTQRAQYILNTNRLQCTGVAREETDVTINTEQKLIAAYW